MNKHIQVVFLSTTSSFTSIDIGRSFIVSILIAIPFITGCNEINLPSESLPSYMNGSSTSIDLPPDQTYDLLIEVLAGRYFIERQDRYRKKLMAVSPEYTEYGQTETIADILGSSQRGFRRLVYAKVEGKNSGSIITIQVLIQRNDTADITAFSYQREPDDRPANISQKNTIIDYKDRRREKWTTVKRDYREEKKLIETIQKEALKLKDYKIPHP